MHATYVAGDREAKTMTVLAKRMTGERTVFKMKRRKIVVSGVENAAEI